MIEAILIFVSLVFLALAVICFILSRDDPIDNDFESVETGGHSPAILVKKTPVEDLPDNEKITISYPYKLYK